MGDCCRARILLQEEHTLIVNKITFNNYKYKNIILIYNIIIEHFFICLSLLYALYYIYIYIHIEIKYMI